MLLRTTDGPQAVSPEPGWLVLLASELPTSGQHAFPRSRHHLPPTCPIRGDAGGRSDFNTRERAIVEFARYRCFLLGLPEELLPTTPEEIIHVMHARAATLRDDFDDEICGELVRATMSSYLKPTRSLPDRFADAIEKSYSKFFFNRTFLNGDGKSSAGLGVAMGLEDHAIVALFAPLVFGSFWAANTTSRLPIVGAITDRVVTEVLKQRLVSYGKPEFTTDASKYTPVAKAQPASAA